MGMDYIRKRIYERKLAKNRKSLTATQKYNKMRNAIVNIAHQDGFKEIVAYWEREMEIHNVRLKEIKQALLDGKKVNQSHINTVLASHGLSEKFLMFLVNLLSSVKD